MAPYQLTTMFLGCSALMLASIPLETELPPLESFIILRRLVPGNRLSRIQFPTDVVLSDIASTVPMAMGFALRGLLPSKVGSSSDTRSISILPLMNRRLG